MRFLIQDPITADEVLSELKEIQPGSYGQDTPIGGVGPMIRLEIHKFFEDKENMDKLLEQMRIK